MQKLLTKYGLAAHLALLAVAPLILFPFYEGVEVAKVVFWLTLVTVGWAVLEPSVRLGESLMDARYRVLDATKRDPLFWVTLALVGYAGLRALNIGISFSYNAETAAWYVSEPRFPILPGVVGDGGVLPLSVALALAVILQACRHSLGRAARMSFLLLTSTLSGLAAVMALVASLHGELRPIAAFAVGDDPFSFVGLTFGLGLIGGTVALVEAFERQWRFAFFLLVLAIGGNGAGLFAFAPPYLSAALAVVALVMLAYSFVYSFAALKDSGKFRLLAVWGIFLTLGGLLVGFSLPEEVFEARIDAFGEFKLFSENFWENRALLSAVAVKSWVDHLWVGTGQDSFPLVFRFGAGAEDWAVFPRGVSMPAHGWLSLLTEGGIVGLVCFALPFGFLLFTYVRQFIGGISKEGLPHPACFIAPLVLVPFVATGFFDCSSLRGEAVMIACAYLAVSAASFQVTRGGANG